MSERYSRQTLFFPRGEADQARLGAARVALVGCGALGTVMAGLLARAGVGYLRIVDRDVVELSNLQRQTLFDEQDVADGLPKSIAAARKLALANSEVTIDPRVSDLNRDNGLALLADVDLVLDAADNFEARYLINDVRVSQRKPWIYSAAIGGYGVTMNILPGETPCLRCVFPVAPTPGTVETCDTAGVIGPIGGVIGSLAVAEALKLLIGARDRLRTGLFWLDLWNNTVQSTPLTAPVKDCPTCQQGRLDFLEGGGGGLTTSLCGRQSVQVRPAATRAVRFDDLGERLKVAGQVEWNDFVLRLRVDGFELTLFPDARALVKGTDDPAVARGLYARYIGS